MSSLFLGMSLFAHRLNRKWMLLSVSAMASFALMGFSCQDTKSANTHLSTSQGLSGKSSNSYNGAINLDKSRTGVSIEQYQRLAALLDNPNALFQKASYQPLWTSEPGRADARLPKGCHVVPPQARLWEPWFRNALQNNGQTLSTAEVLLVRDNVCMAVILDSRTQFRPPQRMQDIARSIEQVRKEVLAELGVSNPSRVLTQLTMADTAWAWSKSQRRYGFDTTKRYFDAQKRWPTGDEFVKEDLTVECMMSVALMMSVLREMDRVSGASGIKVGGICGGESGADHAVNGVAINMGNGKTANLYLDPTATPDFTPEFFHKRVNSIFAKGEAMLDRASLEAFMGRFLTREDPDDARRLGLTPSYAPDGLFILGENWGKTFNLGNFVPYKLNKVGRVLNAYKPGQGYNDPNQGYRPFNTYRKQNAHEVAALQTVVWKEAYAILGRN